MNDGEINALLSSRGTISRGGQMIDRELTNTLFTIFTFEAPNYYVGIPCSKCHPRQRQFVDMLIHHRSAKYPLANIFINDNVMDTKELFERKIDSFYQQVWLVCSETADVLSFTHHILQPHNVIRISSTNAFNTDYHRLKDIEIPNNTLVLFCCGPLGRVLASRWFIRNQTLACWELGSFFDPLLHKRSYMYHHGLLPYCSECNSNPCTKLVYGQRIYNQCAYKEIYYGMNWTHIKNLYNKNWELVARYFDIVSQNETDKSVRLVANMNYTKAKMLNRISSSIKTKNES